ncbi:HesA/MoeB/ThiF family protein [Candidatus Pandoraea novymonadis]|uniref:Molybdopterin-synthase adenylyltransferase n=1 Tax=Candidatus Pandoraea novymonadis TaxID=1808959 RepID=A0ABX5FD89_9BURK|nr:molybdopterin-synthase adenylyltransferase MoeB [Candidatus Pandoraea novymonadis]PSB91743.1 Molybdopterin-synthase adenylyltransferase [Candidatus Pandoraea novymonadis]
MNDDELLRYSRHILLDEIGIKGQEKLLAAHAIIIGAGGLGSPASLYLAAAGVGHITLIDDDIVDLTNLQRQILHDTKSVGQAKVISGHTRLAQLNPDVQVTAIHTRIDESSLTPLITHATVVIDSSDNFITRHSVNRACVAVKVPLVAGAASRFDGQISVFDMRNPASPCYECLFPAKEPPPTQTCASMGVFAPLVGIIGSMQAAETIKLIVGISQSLAGRLLILDSLRMSWHTMRCAPNPDCLICSK